MPTLKVVFILPYAYPFWNARIEKVCMHKTILGFCLVTFLDKGNNRFFKKIYRSISPK